MTPANMLILAVAGTRPEIIKLAPLVEELQARDLSVALVGTGQHVHMLPSFLKEFGLVADVVRDGRTCSQKIGDFLGDMVSGLTEVIGDLDPTVILVQGDTSSALAGALAGFYAGRPVVHLEAGLRSPVLTDPFPEEGNRRLIDQLSSVLLAPTPTAARNLRREGFGDDRIYLTGNTVVDALQTVLTVAYKKRRHEKVTVPTPTAWLVTLHRRESWDQGISNVCQGLARALDAFPSMRVQFPMHPNPVIREQVQRVLGHRDRVALVEPMGYRCLIKTLTNAHAVVTDSGGIQEEAVTLGRPVVVARNFTERPEVFRIGRGFLAGTSEEGVLEAISTIMEAANYARMARPSDAYGDGKASKRCADAIIHAIAGGARPSDFRPADAVA